MVLNKSKDLLFSCSNDKTINIWKVPEKPYDSNGVTITSSYLIHQYHKDYIKSMCYSEQNHLLYACGYDGLISCHNIEEYNKTGFLKFNSENVIYSNGQANSIYSIDCDMTGRTILASTYENTIVGIDTRQKKEIMHLRMHKDIVRSVKISPDGKIVSSGNYFNFFQ